MVLIVSLVLAMLPKPAKQAGLVKEMAGSACNVSFSLQGPLTAAYTMTKNEVDEVLGRVEIKESPLSNAMISIYSLGASLARELQAAIQPLRRLAEQQESR